MISTTVLGDGSLTVVDYRCEASVSVRPFTELHGACSVSFVRKGSFGYASSGIRCELVPGSTLLGCAGDDYVCTHDHVCGDECLSFQLSPELVEALDDRPATWRAGALPPSPELVVLGELAQAAAEGRGAITLEEAGLLYVARVVALLRASAWPAPAADARARQRAVEA